MSSLSSHLTQQICDYLVHSKCLNLQSQNRREELLVRQDWSGGVGTFLFSALLLGKRMMG